MVFDSFIKYNLSAQDFVINLTAAVAIILIGVVAARFLSRLVKRILHDLEINRVLKDQAGVRISVDESIGNLTKFIIYFLAVFLALNQLGLSIIALQIVLALLLLILVGFIILAFKDFIPNIIAGFIIHQKQILKKGNIIQFKEFKGMVIETNLLDVKLQTKSGDIVHIPNSVLTKNEVIKLKSKRLS